MLILPAVVLAGCSAPSEPEPEPVTVTSTVLAEPTQPPASADRAENATAAAGAEPAGTDVPQGWNPSQVGGTCGTVDGGIRVEAKSATSCGFAWELYKAALSATYTGQHDNPSDPTSPTVAMARGLRVASPVTGETYPITCFKSSGGETLSCLKLEDGASITLHGDDTVRAEFHGPTPAFWHSQQAPV